MHDIQKGLVIQVWQSDRAGDDDVLAIPPTHSAISPDQCAQVAYDRTAAFDE